MEENTEKKKVVKKVTLSCSQACNELKFAGRNRRVAMTKYKNEKKTLEQWKTIFKKDF